MTEEGYLEEEYLNETTISTFENSEEISCPKCGVTTDIETLELANPIDRDIAGCLFCNPEIYPKHLFI